jgi:hypothetical protein
LVRPALPRGCTVASASTLKVPTSVLDSVQSPKAASRSEYSALRSASICSRWASVSQRSIVKYRRGFFVSRSRVVPRKPRHCANSLLQAPPGPYASSNWPRASSFCHHQHRPPARCDCVHPLQVRHGGSDQVVALAILHPYDFVPFLSYYFDSPRYAKNGFGRCFSRSFLGGNGLTTGIDVARAAT